MRVDSHPCYILHKRPYRETSLLVEVFSQLHGRIGLIARGAKRPSANQSALIQPFRRLSLAWSAKGELGTLIGIESDGEAIMLNGAALIAGFYINELVVRLLHRDEAHQKLFGDYDHVIQSLARHGSQEQELRLFEIRLLEGIGYGLVVDHDVISGEAVQPDACYEYVSERGPSVATEKTSGHVLIHGATLIDLFNRQFSSEQSLREAKSLLRQEIAQHLGGRALASRSLYQAYLRNNKSASGSNS